MANVWRFTAYLALFLAEPHASPLLHGESKSVVIYIAASSRKKGGHATTLPALTAQGHWMQFSGGARYLGGRITNTLTDDDEIRSRIQKTHQLFGSMRQLIFSSKDVWIQVKQRLLTAMLLPTLLDGAGHWVVSAGMLRELTTEFNAMVRACLRFSTHTQRRHRITTEETLALAGMQPLSFYLDWKILGYAGHVQRMSDTRAPKIFMNAAFAGTKRSGGQPKSHERQRRDCLRRKGIDEGAWRDLAQDKGEWRRLIKAVPVLQPPPPKKFPSTWAKDPDLLIGEKVERKFGTKWFVGEIIGADFDCDFNELIWGVLYDDGDYEDMNQRELHKYICLDQVQVFAT